MCCGVVMCTCAARQDLLQDYPACLRCAGSCKRSPHLVAQVADIADVVRQQADALMLCGETAAGQFPDKCVGVLRAVATSIEEWCRWGPAAGCLWSTS